MPSFSRFSRTYLKPVLGVITISAFGTSMSGSLVSAETLVRLGKAIMDDFDYVRLPRGTEHPSLFDITEGLVTFGKDGSLIPGIAESWEISEDGETVQFTLRSNAKWSDGTPITAHDFERSVRVRLQENREGSVESGLLIRNIVGAADYLDNDGSLEDLGITAIDDLHLELRLLERDFYLADSLASYALWPLPPGWEDMNVDGGNGFPPASGAFMPVEYKPNEYLLLEKNPYYYQADEIEIDKVQYHVYTNNDQSLMDGEGIYPALLGGTLHFARRPRPDVTEWFQENHPEFLLKAPYRSLNYLELNFDNPSLANREIRRALALAVDFEAVQNFYSHLGTEPIDRWFIQGIDPIPEATFQRDERPYPARLREAKSIMREQGYFEDNRLPITFRGMGSPYSLSLTKAIKGMWEQLPIDLELINHENSREFYVDYMVEGDFDIAFPAWTGTTEDLGYFIYFAHSDPAVSSMFNFGNYKNAEFDTAIDAANSADSLESRNAYLIDAERILVEDFGKIPVSRNVTNFLVSPDVISHDAGRGGIYQSQYFVLAPKS